MVAAMLILGPWAAKAEPLAGTQPLAIDGDLSVQMVAGIGRWLDRETARVSALRVGAGSVEERRERLRRILGAVDELRPGALELVNGLFPANEWRPTGSPAASQVVANHVRWPVFDDVVGEGLLLQPVGAPRAVVIVLPDADQTPEMLAGLQPGWPGEAHFARRLAERGCLVVVPALVDRRSTWSGSARLKRFTNQPHREWIYRQTFGLGRSLIGYEVQSVQAALDAAAKDAPGVPVGVFGYGEGGLLALCSTALDPRIAVGVVSGYFGPRAGLWQEPIDRNLFGLLRSFGDVEIAALAAPRRVLVEQCLAPAVDGPPPGRGAAAPGRIATPAVAEAEAEVRRANGLASTTHVTFLHGANAALPGRGETLEAFLSALGVRGAAANPNALHPRGDFSTAASDARQQRMVRAWEAHTQRLLRHSDSARAPKLWASLKKPADFSAAQAELRRELWEDVIG